MNAEADHSPVKISVRNLNFFYTKAVQSLFDNNLDIRANRITAVIGPSGCGKSTHLRVYNRIFELYRGQRADGQVLIDGRNILDPAVDVLELRRKVGMIFQKPTPFPMSVFDNVAYPMRLHFKLSRSEIADRVEAALKGASLWDEVKDKLDKSAYALSGGQQQRLCIARTLALNPDVILFDEPCSALDPISTLAIEDLMSSIVADRAIVIVTHNMEQASRVSNRTAFFYMGDMVEYDETDEIFQRPKDKRLNDYLTGMFS